MAAPAAASASKEKSEAPVDDETVIPDNTPEVDDSDDGNANEGGGKKKLIPIIAAVAALLIIGGGVWWWLSSGKGGGTSADAGLEPQMAELLKHDVDSVKAELPMADGSLSFDSIALDPAAKLVTYYWTNKADFDGAFVIDFKSTFVDFVRGKEPLAVHYRDADMTVKVVIADRHGKAETKFEIKPSDYKDFK